MSQYIHFFIRNDEDFLPIGTFSRNSIIYRTVNEVLNVPYEQIRSINGNSIENCIKEAERVRDTMKDRVAELKEERALISTFNNSVEDKLAAIGNITQTIEDYEEEIDSYIYAIGFFNTLGMILDDVRFDDMFNSEYYIYCGIECPRPTVEDIIE